jgi:2-polyprenyl-6-methoxyphenol hydroxylase-like FAD-dependent oxidoreductase
VSLLEQHRFPRDKVCGECLSALGADVLRRLGLFDALLLRRPVKLLRTALHAPSGASAVTKLPRPMWGVSRVALDGLLLDAARAAGVTVLQPARAEALDPGNCPGAAPRIGTQGSARSDAILGSTAGTPEGASNAAPERRRPAVRVRDLVTNAVTTLSADHVLVADGKAALLGGGPPPPTSDLGVKAHFADVAHDGAADCIELFGLSDCYGGLAPIEGNRWNAAFSVPAARVRHHRGNLAAAFAELVSENVTLSRRLATAHRLGPFLASPLPRFPVRRDWPQNVIPVGNAAAALEPIGGEGMGLAMRSAELVAEALMRADEREQVLDRRALARAYQRLWRTRSAACRLAAIAVSSSRSADRFLPLLSAAPAALRPVLSLMGK